MTPRALARTLAAMTKKKGGLSVAMIVVGAVLLLCVCGGVGGAVVGFTQYNEYVVRSKTSEASSNLRDLFTLSAGYYANESWGLRTVTAGAPTASTACTVDPATTSNVPGPSKTVVDWTSEPRSFQDIGFAVADPIYYQYAIDGQPGRCGWTANTPLYTFRAYGDLDGDGTRSRFELTAHSDETNVLTRAPDIRIQDETE